MLLNREVLGSALRTVAATWADHVPEFNEIDSRFGDGDHGVTMGKIAALIDRAVANWGEQGLKDLLKDLATDIMAIGGGSAGPLYGTVFDGLAAGLDSDTEAIDANRLRSMFGSCRDAMRSITKAQVGDKTMMDALLPAVAAAEACTQDIPDTLQAAAEAAAQGAEATRNMVSKFGRARSYGDQTLGTPDAGALSTALFFDALRRGVTAA
jgi:dihydroxyacetone kinase-like protein